MNGGVLITLTRCPNSQIMHPVTQGTASSVYIYSRETERAIFHVTRTLPVISKSGATAIFKCTFSEQRVLHLHTEVGNKVYFLILCARHIVSVKDKLQIIQTFD